MYGLNAAALVFFGCINVLAYYLLIAAFVLLTIRGFFRSNQKQYHRFDALRGTV